MTTGKLDTAKESDSGAAGDNITNITDPIIIIGTAMSGVSTVTVSFRDPNGKLFGPYAASPKTDGTFQVKPLEPLKDNSTDTKGTQYTPVITVTNQTGLKITSDGTPFTVDNQALKLNLAIDSDRNNDGSISRGENGNIGPNDTTKDLTLTATFKTSEVNIGDLIRFKLSNGDFKDVSLTEKMVSEGKVNITFPNEIKHSNVIKVDAEFIDKAGNKSLVTDSAKVDLDVGLTQPVGQQSPEFTVIELLAHKSVSSAIWKIARPNDVLTKVASNFLASDSTGNMFSSDTNIITSTKYSNINTEINSTKIQELTIGELELIEGIRKIKSSTANGIKSINISGEGIGILSVDLLDVLNYGVNDILKINLGDQPQFKIDGDSEDKLNLTNIMNGSGNWTNVGAINENYTHWSGFALGLEVDLLVHKNIAVNIA